MLKNISVRNGLGEPFANTLKYLSFYRAPKFNTVRASAFTRTELLKVWSNGILWNLEMRLFD
jgi:hypothetical protein